MNTLCATTYHTSLHFIHHSMSFTMSAWACKVIVKGPKPPCKPHDGQAKKTVDLDKDKAPADSNDGIVCITWNLPCTEHLVQWLEDNVEDHQRLFSDLAQDAKDEKCHTRVAKSEKGTFYTKMADYIFSADNNVKIQDQMKIKGPQIYAKVIENRIAK